MTLVDRVNEMEVLEKIYHSNTAEFLAIYGRRRVGKTYLIKEFFKNKKCLFFHITGIKDGSLTEQLTRFIKAISKTFFKGSELKDRKSWLDAF